MQRNPKIGMDLVRFSLSLLSVIVSELFMDFFCLDCGGVRDTCTYSNLNSNLLDVWFHCECCYIMQGSSVLVALYLTVDVAYCCNLSLWKGLFYIKLGNTEIDDHI